MQIDFVLLWVNDQDDNWQREKNRYIINGPSRMLNGQERYRDYGLLRYWFRMVETQIIHQDRQKPAETAS